MFHINYYLKSAEILGVEEGFMNRAQYIDESTTNKIVHFGPEAARIQEIGGYVGELEKNWKITGNNSLEKGTQPIQK